MFQRLSVIFSTGNVEEVDTLFSESYVDHQRPDWMKEEGAEEFKAIVKLARDSLPNLQVSIQGEVAADSNIVAGRMLWQCDLLERETIEMLRIENGKFIEHWGAESWSHQILSD